VVVFQENRFHAPGDFATSRLDRLEGLKGEAVFHVPRLLDCRLGDALSLMRTVIAIIQQLANAL